MFLISWNVAGLGPTLQRIDNDFGGASKEDSSLKTLSRSHSFSYFLKRHGSPDILCIQEHKIPLNQLASRSEPFGISSIEGYESYWSCCIDKSKRGFNGVVTLVKEGCCAFADSSPLNDEDLDMQGRCVMTDHGDFVVFNVYVPCSDGSSQSMENKLRFIEALEKAIRRQKLEYRKKIIIAGDLNICLTQDDIHWSFRTLNVDLILDEVELHNTSEHMLPRWKIDLHQKWSEITETLKNIEAVPVTTKNVSTGETFEKYRARVTFKDGRKKIFIGSHETSADDALRTFSFGKADESDEKCVPLNTLMDLMSKIGGIEWDHHTVQDMKNYRGPATELRSLTVFWLRKIMHDFDLIDSFRHCYPRARNRFTCWNQYSNRRFENEGTRIDYILISKEYASSLGHGLGLRCGQCPSNDCNSEESALHAATSSGMYVGASFVGGGIACATTEALNSQFGPRSTGIIYTPPIYSDHVATSLLLDDDNWDEKRLQYDLPLRTNDPGTRKAQPHKTQQSIANYFHKAPKKQKVVKRYEKMNDGDMSWVLPSHFHQTRKGKILQVVSELYVRHDLGLGYTVPTHVSLKHNSVEVHTQGSAEKISDAAKLHSMLVEPPIAPNTIVDLANEAIKKKKKKIRLVILDTNVLLHNLDIIEHPSFAISNIVIPQTALAECRNRSYATYDRVVDLFKSGERKKRCVIFYPDRHALQVQTNSSTAGSIPNDQNDAIIRNVAEFYGREMMGSGVEVVLLSDDSKCRELAFQEQKNFITDCVSEQESKILMEDTLLYHPRSVRQHIIELEREDPNLSLSDIVAQFSSFNVGSKTDVQQFYPPHLSQSEISIGLKSGRYFQGVIRAERGCYDRCYMTVKKGDDRVAISIIGGKDINRAIDGDVVAIEIHPLELWHAADNTLSIDSSKPPNKEDFVGIPLETAEPNVCDEENVSDTIEIGDPEKSSRAESLRKRPSAQVVGIIRRNFRQNYCGSIYSVNDETIDESHRSQRDLITSEYETEHPDGSFTCVLFTCDGRIPPILFRTLRRDHLLGKRILVAIDSWPADSRFPLGHYVETIGDAGLKDVETDVLLYEHKIPCDPFPAKVLACLPPEDYKIICEAGRVDLRHLPILSIDPPGCKDIDDALHCIVLPNNNWQIGVHIADVTHYVKPGSAMDVEAANRSTSTYLVNKRIDMLPGYLTTDLCSLRENVDRFAFSVLWEVSPQGDILNVDFQKTIIHSIGALTYQQAQALIDHPGDHNADPKVNAVKRLATIARIFRAKRIAAGALTLASTEVKFVLDSESLNPTDIQAYSLFESNALVEEFMLLANVTVSKRILRNFPTLSILRRHPAPNRSMFDSLISKAKCRGVTINIDDSKKLADSLDAAILKDDPYFNKLLRILSTRCMSPAQYFCSGEYRPSDWHHYGLATHVYTHFTSPIRRYADVCVHRLLAAAIGVEPLPNFMSSKSYLHDLAANMNRRHRAAQLAGRASVQLHTLLVFSENQHDTVDDAYVLDVDCNNLHSVPSLTVIVPRYGVEGRVHLSNLQSNDPLLIREPEIHMISYREINSERIISKIQVFDKVSVKITVNVIQKDQKELVLELLNPYFGTKDQIQESGSLKRKRRNF